MKPGDSEILQVLKAIFNDIAEKTKECIEAGKPHDGLMWAGNLISAYYGKIKDGASDEFIEFVKSGDI